MLAAGASGRAGRRQAGQGGRAAPACLYALRHLQAPLAAARELDAVRRRVLGALQRGRAAAAAPALPVRLVSGLDHMHTPLGHWRERRCLTGP